MPIYCPTPPAAGGGTTTHDIDGVLHDGFPGGTTTFLRADGTFASPAAGATDVEEAEVDFGNVVGLTDKTFTITDADVTTASRIVAQVMSVSPSDGRNVDEVEWETWDIYCRPGTGTFDLTMKNRFGSVMGRFVVGYIVG